MFKKNWKGLFRHASPNHVTRLHLQTNTVTFSSTNMKCGWREIDWATKLCREGLWHVKLHEYHQRLNGRIERCDRGRSTYEAPTSHNPQARGTIEKSREGTTFYLKRLICSATGLLKFIQSCPVLDIFNPNRHLPHPPTSERCSDFQKSSVIVDHP